MPEETKATEAAVEEKKKEKSRSEAETRQGGEEKELSPEVKKIVDSVAKLKSAEKTQLGLEIIKNLTVMELSGWVKSLEDEFGVSAVPVAQMSIGATPGVAVPGAIQEEEQTEFQVVLVSAGDKKIQVIKEVRVLTNLGLREAKDLVDNPPKAVKEGLPKKEAEEIKAKLEAQGAKVELK